MKQKIPTSPFATRLSGSARETELRLRSIFQWKKKRPPVVLLAAAILLVIACSSLVSFQSAAPEDTAQPDDSIQEERLADSVTYVTFDSLLSGRGAIGGYLPVSYIKDGIQVLANDELYADGSTDFDINLYIDDILPKADSLNKTDYVASNGTWNFFPVQAEHKIYTWENQPEQEEWIEYFREKLSEVGASDTPVVITEAWIFDWNGIETAAVNASNVIVSDDETMETIYVAGAGGGHAEPNLPPRENTVMYMMSTLFTQGNAPVDMVDIEYCYREIGREPEGLSYLPPDHGSYQHIFSAVQYDENGDLIVCPVFCDFMAELLTRQFKYSPEQYLVCDIDGNGEVELIGCLERNSSYECKHEVYQLIDGKPECVFALLHQ